MPRSAQGRSRAIEPIHPQLVVTNMHSRMVIACLWVFITTSVAHACQCGPHDAKAACYERRKELATAIAQDYGRVGHLIRPGLLRVTAEYQDKLIRKGYLKARVADAPPFIRKSHHWPDKVPPYLKPHYDHFVVFAVRNTRKCEPFLGNPGEGESCVDHRLHVQPARFTDQVHCLVHTIGWSDAQIMQRSTCWYPDCVGGDKPLAVDGIDGCPSEAEWKRVTEYYEDQLLSPVVRALPSMLRDKAIVGAAVVGITWFLLSGVRLRRGRRSIVSTCRSRA
jgi:hypothetical protein